MMARTAAAAVPASGGERLAALLQRPSFASFRKAATELGTFALFGALPLAFSVFVFVQHWRLGILHFDFRGTVWEPSQAIVHGHSPYPPARFDAVDVGNPALYPPSTVLVGLPLLALPFALAASIWIAVLLGAVAGALRLLGVRDWRCYMLALSSFPVLLAATFGNATLLLVAAAALAWRYRDRPVVTGVAVGLAIALKLFLWPLGIWLLVTRRFRAALVAAVAASAAVFVPWAAIGFDGLRDYPSLLRVATDVFAPHSDSLYAGALGLGLPSQLAHRAALAAGLLLLAGAAALARRPDGDRRAFAVTIAAALVLSPIVWPHYFALLLVPLAIARPAFDRVWLAMPGFWLAFFLLPLPSANVTRATDVPAKIWGPLHASAPPLWQIAGFSALAAAVIAASVRRRRGVTA